VRLSKKFAAIAITATVALTGTAALAYWTNNGSGGGSALVGSDAGNEVTVTATVDDGVVPGGSADVSFTASNDGPTDLFVGTISLDSVTADEDHADCAVADFTMDDVISNSRVPAGSTDLAIAGDGSLDYESRPLVDQDSCKGATLTLVLSNS
jgi:hypothetical protein